MASNFNLLEGILKILDGQELSVQNTGTTNPISSWNDDSYLRILPEAAGEGPRFYGYGSSEIGASIRALAGTPDVSSDTSARGVVELSAVDETGGSETDLSASENMLVVRNRDTARLVVKADGSILPTVNSIELGTTAFRFNTYAEELQIFNRVKVPTPLDQIEVVDGGNAQRMLLTTTVGGETSLSITPDGASADAVIELYDDAQTNSWKLFLDNGTDDVLTLQQDGTDDVLKIARKDDVDVPGFQFNRIMDTEENNPGGIRYGMSLVNDFIYTGAAGGNIFGLDIESTMNAGVATSLTTNVRGISSRTTISSGLTLVGSLMDFRASSAIAGAVDNWYGMLIDEPTGAGTVDNQYGIFLNDFSKGATNNFAIYAGGSTVSHFGGPIAIGRFAPTHSVDVFRNVAAYTAFGAENSAGEELLVTLDSGSNGTRVLTDAANGLTIGTTVASNFGVNTNGSLRFLIDSGGELATGGETAPDVSSGGLCLRTNSNGNYLTMKNSALLLHPYTGFQQDTFVRILPVATPTGGNQVDFVTRGQLGDGPSLLLRNIGGTGPAVYPMVMQFSKHNGAGGLTNYAITEGLLEVRKNDGTQVLDVRGDGEINSGGDINSSKSIEADTGSTGTEGFVCAGNTGINTTLNFFNHGTGSLATVTVVGGIITGFTLHP